MTLPTWQIFHPETHWRGGLQQATLRWNEKYNRSLSSNNKERRIFFQDVEALYQKVGFNLFKLYCMT